MAIKLVPRSVDLLVDRMNSKWFGLNKNLNVFSTEIIPTNSILENQKITLRLSKKSFIYITK